MLNLTINNQSNNHLDDILNDDYYKKIINTLAFKRLKNISFLGAIDYAITPKKMKKNLRTRYAHSLGVAALAKFVSEKRNYNKQLERHLVVAALLHDIGHAPLSHSIEPMFKSKWGLNHHDVGEKIIKGELKKSKSLKKIIDSKLDSEFLLELIEGQYSGEGGDLFSSQINIDTIDGIIRASKYLSTTGQQLLCPFSVAQAAFDDNSSAKTTPLDEFWKLKQIIYQSFILSSTGLKADIISQEYFHQHENVFSKDDFVSHEGAWKKTHAPLFELLKNLNDLSSIDGDEVSITKRHYTINYLSSGEDRYLCRREKSKYKFSDKTLQEEKQTYLL